MEAILVGGFSKIAQRFERAIYNCCLPLIYYFVFSMLLNLNRGFRIVNYGEVDRALYVRNYSFCSAIIVHNHVLPFPLTAPFYLHVCPRTYLNAI